MRWLSDVLKEQYGEKVYKLSLSSGCTCPNRDGTLGYGGCTFCSEGGSGDFAAETAPIENQIEEAKSRIRKKTDAKKFIAYFQSFTNTYGDIDYLRDLYTRTIARDDVVILSIGTRPDCLPREMVDMLSDLNKIKPVWIELGLQTAHDETARRVHRGYDLKVFEKAYERLTGAGLSVIVHLIFGLPGEDKEDMLSSVRYLAELSPPPEGVKLQMLHILKGTQMGREYEEKPFEMMDLSSYSDLIAESIRILPKNMVIHRVTGDGPRRLLLAPLWTLDKKVVLNTIHRKIDQILIQEEEQ